MLARALLLGLLALASISSQAWATGPAYYPPGGSGSGVVANTCSAGDFFSAVDAGGTFTCSTAAGSGDVTSVGDCTSGACFDGTTGSTLTAAPAGHLLLKSSNSMYFDADTGTASTGNGFVFRSNGTALTLFRVIEDGYADLRNGLDLRLYETDDSNYVQLSAPTLAANYTLTLPVDDGNASQFLQTDGSGVSTWATAVTGATADSGGTTTGATVTLAGGAGITTARSSDTVTFATASSEQNFLASGALTCGASTNGKMQVHTTPLQYCDNAGTPTLQYAAYGNSSGESTAAANNSVAMGTDTTGDYVATITGGTGITSSGATSGESIAHSLSFDATEIDSPTWSNGGSASLTHTWNLSGTDPVLTLQSGAFNLTGNTLIGATGSGGSLTVNSTSNATKGSIILDDKVDLWPNIPDFSASAMEVMEFNSDLDLSGVALFHSIFHLDPTIHIGQAGGFLGGIVAVSTEGMLIAHDDATTASTNLPIPLLFWADHIIETTVAIAAPMDSVLLDQVEKRSTGAITVPTGGTHRTVWSAPRLKASTNATATYDEVSGLYWGPVAGTDFTTDGTALTVSEANAVKVANPTKDSGTGTTTYTEVNGLNCSDLTVATTNSCVKSAVTANSARYFLNDTGGAQSKLTGKFTTYNNVTTAGTGLPIITGESGVSATKTADFTALSYTPPATAGRYRVEQVITTTSGTNTGSFQCTVDYVDSRGTTHTADLMPMVNQTGLWATALPVVAGASKEWHCGPTYITINNSATAIVLKVDVTTGTVNYTVAASVEQLG